MNNPDLENACENVLPGTSIFKRKLTKSKRNKWSKFLQSYITESEIKLFEVKEKQANAQVVFKKFVKRKQQLKREEKNTIEKFVKKHNVPPWYRELSETQMAAADSLHTSIRDDLEQGTVHRCRRALLSLGLKPLITRMHVSLALKMCAGSDFAFLWFLMELFYDKTCANCKHAQRNYTVNEQLIMSAICHLDMITTLRQLDKLLPLPRKEVTMEKVLPKQQKPNKSVSPYLQPLIRPVCRSKELFTKIVLPPVKFAPYDKYLDKSYLVPNEATRWFTHGLQADIASANFDPSPRKSSIDIVSHILERQINKVGERKIGYDHELHALCKTHQEERKMHEKMFQAMLDEKKFSQIEGLRNVKKQKIVQERVKSLMDADQQKALKQNEELTNNLQFETWLRIFVQDLALNIPDQSNLKLHQKAELMKDEAISLEKILSRTCCICNKCPYKAFQFDHQGTPKRTSIYFTGPRKHAPYVFNYEKIFQVDCVPKLDTIKQGITDVSNFFKFLTDNEEFWREFEFPGPPRQRKSSVQSMQPNLQAQFEVYELESIRKTDFYPNEFQGNDMKDKTIRQLSSEKTSQSNQRFVSTDGTSIYNPKNTSQMEKLLKDAFDKMKQDARFVLVTLPDAHRLPILVEWIRARYGNIYSKKQREDTLKKSLQHFEHLQARPLEVVIPETKEVWDENDASYYFRDQIMRKTKIVKDNYFHEVRLQLLDDARVCWEVMKPYHCTSGPPRNIFYAYMPASEYDILPFRPWKLCEFVDAASGFEKRKNLEKQNQSP